MGSVSSVDLRELLDSVSVDPYLGLLGLITLLFFLPKLLVRLGIPSPVTEMGLGVAVGPLGLALVEPSNLLTTLSGLGISSMFLFAGVEVGVRELLKRRRRILEHSLLQVGLFAVAAWIGMAAFGLSLPVAVLVAAAVLSSSAAFIIPALDALGFGEELNTWIKQKAITTELIAILTVLAFSNADSSQDTLRSVGAIVLLIGLVPLAFWTFHRTILRWAPRTEFSFMMIVALLAAYVSDHVGVHYLVGAFVVGLIARRYLRWCEHLGESTTTIESALDAFRFFASFLMPFFFFVAGLHLPASTLGGRPLLMALALVGVTVPLRIGLTTLHRRLSLREPWSRSWNVALLLTPTTVFSVAAAEILRERFDVDPNLTGALVLYGALTSLAPLLRREMRRTAILDLESLQRGTTLGGSSPAELPPMVWGGALPLPVPPESRPAPGEPETEEGPGPPGGDPSGAPPSPSP